MLQMLLAMIDNWISGRKRGELAVKAMSCIGVAAAYFGGQYIGMGFVLVAAVLYFIMGGLSLWKAHKMKSKEPYYSVTLPFQTLIVGMTLCIYAANGMMPLYTENTLGGWGAYLALLSVFSMGLLPEWVKDDAG